MNGGVRRAHLILPFEGALLKELYTRDGAGILISRDTYEGLRQATASDLRDIQEITRPLEAEGILKPRTAEEMERELENCFLLTRDNDILAMGMLKQFGDQHAEIYCLAVHPSYRRGGKGETMLAYLERRALMMGLPYVFVLSTRTMQWFEERGFEIATPADLPPERHFDPSRNSRIYMKRLRTERDVDEEEVLWDIT